MSSNPSDIWSPPQETTTYTDTFSPSRYSYSSHSSSRRLSSDGDDSASHVRRLAVSPSPSQNDDVDDDDMYTEGNSIDEVDNALSNLEDEFDDTEQAVSEWSHGSYSSAGPTFSSATGTFTYSGTYTGSPSFVSLPTFSPRSPVPQINPRLSRITERTEESREQQTRPSSTAFSASNTSRPANATPDTRRHSAALGITPSHSRSSTDPSSDRTLPPPGRLSELRAVFESQGTTTSHSRATSSPAYRSSSPMFGSGPTTSTGYTQGTTTGYTQGTSTGYTQGTTSYGYSSRPSSPTKSGSSSGSYTHTGGERSLLSPPPTRTSSGFRSTTNRTEGDYTPSYTATPSNFSRTTNTWTNPRSVTQTGSYTTPASESKGYTNSDTYTETSMTPTSGFQRTQGSPRSPLASVRNVIALWKERTPAGPRGERSAAGSVSSTSPPLPTNSENDGLYGVRRRVEGARARLRESRQVSNPNVTPTRPTSGDAGDTSSITSRRSRGSGVFPPGFDMNELSAYAQSSEPPLHIGLLWYLNVHAPPPYRWQRCQALLYPHMLLLSWLAPGGGRGIVALDLLNCTSVESALSPTQEGARDDVGTMAARQQTEEVNGQRLQDILVPFHMMYADGVERLAAESLLERRKWVNRLWEAVNRPVAVPDSVSVTRSPTGSIRTILSMDSSVSRVSSGSRSTVFVPPLSTLPDISDFHSSTSGLSRQSSLLSSYHSGTVDDTVIQNQEYVYRGDPRAITQRRSSRHRSGSMTDLDEEFKSVVHRARNSSGMLGGSPVTVSSGSSLGKNIFVTPPPSLTRSFERTRSESSEDQFFSGSEGRRSNVSSTYFSPGSSTAFRSTALESASAFTPATTDTNLAPSTFNSTFRLTDSNTYSGSSRSGDSDISFADSPSTLSRAREIRRRVAATTNTARSYTSGYLTEGSVTERDDDDASSRRSRTPTESYTYTPDSRDSRDDRSLSAYSGSETGSYLHSRSRTPTGSYTGSDRTRSSRTGSYTGSGTGSYTASGTGSGTGSYTQSGSYTPGSGSYSLQTGHSPIPVSSEIGGFTPISSSETGYDVCTSSDFTEFTRPTLTATTTNSLSVTPVRQPVPIPAEVISDAASEQYLTASLASTEFGTAPALSSRPSVSSFQSFDTIPSLPGSDYASASSGSLGYRTASEPGIETEYRTASEPSEVSLGSDYITCEVCPTIPSEASTPALSSLHLDSESEPDIAPSVVDIPTRLPIIPTPVSTIFSLPPEDIPLPDSLPAPPARPLPSSLTPSPRFQSYLPSSHSPTPRESPLAASLSPSPQLLSPLPSLPPSSAPSTISLSPSSIPLPPSTVATPVPRASPPFSLAGSATPRAESPPLPPLPVEHEELPSPSASPSLPSHHSLPREASVAPSSLTPSLSATPSPLEASLDYGDAPTPSSLQLPTSSDVWSDHDSDDEPSEEDTISLSRLPSLPESTLGDTSIRTPTSLLVPSASTASSLPPSSPAVSEPRPRARTPLTVSSTVGLTTLTQTSSSIPVSPQPWAAYTDVSYESSVLLPSPSTHSVSLHDGPDFSMETSFLRPSGSPSSADRISTIPPSPMTMTQAETPLPALTPVVMLPQSISSQSDALTPTSLDWISDSSSSLGRTLSTSSASSSLSQSSLSSSVLDSGSELGQFEEPEPEVAVALSDISTEPSLLSTAYEPRMATPIPPSEVHVTPAVSAISGSVSTPQGSGATEQSSLRTVPSLSSVITERDLGRDLDRLVDELHGYDTARAQENQALNANVQALRDELKDLTEFLQRSPTPSSPSVVVVQRGPSPRRVAAITEGVQVSPPIEPIIEMHRETPVAMAPIIPFPIPLPRTDLLHPLGPRNLEDLPVMGEGAVATVVRNTSIASSTMSADSILSSHYSDEDLWDDQEVMSELTPRWSVEEEEEPQEEEDEDEDLTETDDSTDSSTLEESTSLSESSSPHTPSAVPSEAVTITQPAVPDILQDSLSAIQDKLRALEDGQGFTHGLIKELKDRPSTPQTMPEDPRPELVERLDRIEGLIHNVLEQSRMPPPAPAPAMPIPSPAPAPSEYPIEPSTDTQYVRAASEIIDTLSDTSSLGRLGSILRHLPAESSEPHMPSPLRPQAGPSIAERLTDILSSQMRMEDVDVEPPPKLVPFVYTPAERGQRPRSASPSSIDFPARSRSVPAYAPVVIPPLNIQPFTRREQPRPHTYRSERSEAPVSRPQTGEPRQEQHPLPHQPQLRPQQQPQRPHVVQERPHNLGPMPRPIFENLSNIRRPETAPVSGSGRPHQTWYHKPTRDSGRHATSSRPSGAPGPPGGPGGPSQGGSQLPDIPQPASRADTIRYMPMPAGPVNVQLPPLFDSLMEILRENRLAQLATVEQQRELMRYMGELNGWLGRDVQDRRTELGGVLARVDQLSQELRSLRMQRAGQRSPTTTSTDDSGPTIYNIQPGMGMPVPQIPNQHVMQGMPPRTFQEYPPGSVIPPVIPDPAAYRTTPMVPAMGMGPVIPTPQPQPTYIIQQPGIPGPGPRIPTDGFPYAASGPGPQHMRPSRPASQATTAFIPEFQDDAGSVTSTGPPRSRPTTPAVPVPAPNHLPPDIIAIPPSASSSEDMSTRPSTRRRTPPGHTPSRPSSRQSRHDAHTPGRRRTPSDEYYDRRGRRPHSGSRHGRRRSPSDSYSPSSRRRRSDSRHSRPDLRVANPSEAPMIPMGPQQPTVIYAPPPTVHVVSPSAHSRRSRSSSPSGRRSRYDDNRYDNLSPHPPQQPTVIIQQPPQQQHMPPGQTIIQMPPSPGPHHPGTPMMPFAPSHMSESPMPMPMTGIPMTGVPMSHPGMPGMPMTGVPMTGVPMTGIPMTGVPMTGVPGGPIIIRSDSPRSSTSRRRSRSGSRRRHTPPAPAPQPIIIGGTSRRSRSRSRSRTPPHHHHSSYGPPPMAMTQPPVILQPTQGQMPMQPIIMPQGSPPPRRRSRSRSHSPRHHRDSREPPIILQNPSAPTYLPGAPVSQAPQPTVLLPAPGVPMVPGMHMMTPTLMRQRSRSSSRGRRRRTPPPVQQAPIIIPPAALPTMHGGRRSRSRSPEYRRHGRSPSRYDSRSPDRRHHRRSTSPRRSRSRTPPRTHTPSHAQTGYGPSRPMTGMPMTGVPMTGVPMTGVPMTHMAPGAMSRYPTHRSTSPRRRSPTRVEVVRDPRSHRSPDRSRYSPERWRSPDRYRRSPERRRYSRSPEGHRRSPGRYRRSPDRSGRDARRYSPGRRSLERDGGRYSRPSDSRYRSPDRRGPRYIPSRGRGDTRSPPSRDRHGRRHARSYSPSVRSRTPSPRRPRRSRTGSPAYGHRSRSPTPTRIPGRPPTGYARSYRDDDRDDERDSPPYRITVPSRHDSARRGGPAEIQRPPTVVPFYPDASRPPTERPHSVAESRPDYDLHSPVPHIAIVPGSSRQGSPTHTARTELEHTHAIPIPARAGTPMSAAASSRPASTAPVAAPATLGNMGERPPSAAKRQASIGSDRTVTTVPTAPRRSGAPIAHIAPTPFAFGEADAARAQLDELSNTAHRLQETADAVTEAENTREAIFQDQELKRQQVFEERERQRQAELDARLEAALSRLQLPSTLDVPQVPQIESRPGSIHSIGDEAADKVSIADSIRLASRAASIHKEELLQIVSDEREEAAEARRESEALHKQNLEELKESHALLLGEKDNRIRELEEELAKLRGDFEADKQQRSMQEQEQRDQEQQNTAEQYQNLHQQLGEVTELVSGQRSCCEEIRQMMEQQMHEKENRRLEKSAHMVELTDMIRTIQKEMDDDRQKRDAEHVEIQTNLQTTVAHLASQNDELRHLLSELSQEWRDECQRHHDETIAAVKATSNLQVPFNVQGYLDEFSRALASEVRLLLGEVGRIREERRALQHEISDLLSMKSKWGPGGEYEPDWKPPGTSAAGPQPPPDDIPPQPPADMGPVKAAWRPVNPRKPKKKRAAQQAAQPVASTSFPPAQHYPYPRPGTMDPELRSQVRSFNQWIPDPTNQVTPPPQQPTVLVSERPHPRGPFGTPSISDEGGMY